MGLFFCIYASLCGMSQIPKPFHSLFHRENPLPEKVDLDFHNQLIETIHNFVLSRLHFLDPMAREEFRKKSSVPDIRRGVTPCPQVSGHISLQKVIHLFKKMEEFYFLPQDRPLVHLLDQTKKFIFASLQQISKNDKIPQEVHLIRCVGGKKPPLKQNENQASKIENKKVVVSGGKRAWTLIEHEIQNFIGFKAVTLLETYPHHNELNPLKATIQKWVENQFSSLLLQITKIDKLAFNKFKRELTKPGILSCPLSKTEAILFFSFVKTPILKALPDTLSKVIVSSSIQPPSSEVNLNTIYSHFHKTQKQCLKEIQAKRGSFIRAFATIQKSVVKNPPTSVEELIDSFDQLYNRTSVWILQNWFNNSTWDEESRPAFNYPFRRLRDILQQQSPTKTHQAFRIRKKKNNPAPIKKKIGSILKEKSATGLIAKFLSKKKKKHPTLQGEKNFDPELLAEYVKQYGSNEERSFWEKANQLKEQSEASWLYQNLNSIRLSTVESKLSTFLREAARNPDTIQRQEWETKVKRLIQKNKYVECLNYLSNEVIYLLVGKETSSLENKLDHLLGPQQINIVVQHFRLLNTKRTIKHLRYICKRIFPRIASLPIEIPVQKKEEKPLKIRNQQEKKNTNTISNTKIPVKPKKEKEKLPDPRHENFDRYLNPGMRKGSFENLQNLTSDSTLKEARVNSTPLSHLKKQKKNTGLTSNFSVVMIPTIPLNQKEIQLGQSLLEGICITLETNQKEEIHQIELLHLLMEVSEAFIGGVQHKALATRVFRDLTERILNPEILGYSTGSFSEEEIL